MGQPIYPIADWTDVPLTSFLYTLIGIACGVFFYIAARVTDKLEPASAMLSSNYNKYFLEYKSNFS